MLRKPAVLFLILGVISSILYAEDPKIFNIALDFGEAAYTEFGFSGNEVNQNNPSPSSIEGNSMEIVTATTTENSDGSTSLVPGQRTVYAFWNVVSVNRIDLYLEMTGPLYPESLVDADGNPVSEGTAGINWSVYWDNDVSHISSESSNQNKNRLVTGGSGNEAMVGSKRLTIKADSINGRLSSMVADDYVATLKLMVDSI